MLIPKVILTTMHCQDLIKYPSSSIHNPLTKIKDNLSLSSQLYAFYNGIIRDNIILAQKTYIIVVNRSMSPTTDVHHV